MSDRTLARTMFWSWLVAIYALAGIALVSADEAWYIVVAATGWAFLVWLVFVTWAWRE